MKRVRLRGFTLIELLVVIAIIALLISILLPALGRARKAGQMAVSMSNMRQMGVAGASYNQANKGKLPVTMTYERGTASTKAGDPNFGLIGWCTWSWAGKNNAAVWPTLGLVKGYDCEAADRPANPYLYPDMDWGAPEKVDSKGPKMPATSDARKIEAKAFKDPSDKLSHQQKWPNPNTDGLSSYDDVGTSYHWNAKWWDQIYPNPINDFPKAFDFGMQRLAIADAYVPSKFAWLNDQYADIIVNRPNPAARVKNGYDDINKSILGFLDGHAAYLTVFPGKAKESYTNDKYTFVFEDLKIPS